MIIVHAADIHLGSPLGGLDQHEGLPVERIRAAPLRAFERIADLCAERGAELLLIAGDLFDGDADLPVIREATRVLQRIASGGTRVVIIRGNHDATSKMQRRLARIDGVVELSTSAPETVSFPDLAVAVHGRGFDAPRVADNIVTTYPARVDGMFNVGVLHTSLEGNAAHASYAPCSVADLVAKGYDYWALGHIHQHGVMSEEPWIVYAGSPQGRHVGETGDHGAYVFEVRDGGLAGRPEHVELGAVRWHVERIEAAGAETTAEELVAAAGERLATLVAEGGTDVTHVVRVELAGRCAGSEQLRREPGRWREELAREAQSVGTDGCFLERVTFATQPVLPAAESLRERHDFVGDLARHLAAEAIVELSVDGGVGVPSNIARLDDKLRTLGAAGDALRGQPVTREEQELAGDELLSRLLVASVDSLEETAG